ncbi:MAG: hypothetical protein GVY20_02195 [Bacteroidetes bacterium]|jgi:hypothetical protein|nr:hypothetical protein [Bacteroidota bacterium]
MKLNIQDSSKTAVDTLSSSYSGKWEGVEGIEQTSAFIQLMASNDLIFVVLGVSLIIWFVLLFYLIRVDRNVSKLEESLKEESSDET